ncbi:hypothetical protein JCM9534A_57850 [Catenuloplanes indicus JCM 9534]
MLLLAGLLAACGEDPSPSGTGDDHGKRLAYAKCMRDNGVDMPDPEPPNALGVAPAERAVPGEDAQAARVANEKCRHLLPNGGVPEPMSAEQRAAALEFARCMREHGVEDFPDPGADGQPGRFDPPVPDDPDYPAANRELTEASEACSGAGDSVPAAPMAPTR